MRDGVDQRIPGIEPRSGWSHEAIRDELERVLAHPEFQATDRMCDFLRFVVEETLAGRADGLKGYTIATGVFGRTEDFDSAQDPVVRIQAGRLRRALERYYLVAGGRDPLQIDIPKGQYVPEFRTNGGVRIAEDSRRPPEQQRLLPGPCLAVLPLEVLSDEEDQEHLALGLAEELVTELGRFQDISVLPCQRAPMETGSAAEVVELCRSAGARFLLTGSLRKDSHTMKVSMHLIDTWKQTQIWAKSYKHELDAGSFIAVQEEIARKVVSAIASEYGIIARRLSAEARKKAPMELDTYEAMLCYYAYQIAPSPEASASCFGALQRAVEREPEYGPAWSALATLHCHRYTFDVPGCEDSLDTALEYARRSVALEPGSQIGRLILSYASLLADDFEVFEQEVETALALNPNSPYANGTAGYFFTLRGDFERGIPLLDHAIRANPFHPDWFHQGYFAHHFCRSEYEAALLELERHRPSAIYWLEVLFAATLGQLGRHEEAQAHLESLAEQKPQFADRSRELLGRVVKFEELVDAILEGLGKAGLTVA